MTKAHLTELANALAESTKEFVTRRVSSLEVRIAELEAQKQLAAARIAALEQATTLLETETKMLRLDLETRAHPGWDTTAKQIYRARQLIGPRTCSFNGCRSRTDAIDTFRMWLTQIDRDHDRRFVTDLLSDPDIDDIDMDDLDHFLADHRRIRAAALEEHIRCFRRFLIEQHIGA